MCGFRPLLVMLAAVMAVGAATGAAAEGKKRRAPAPPVKAAAKAGLRPSISLASRPAITLPGATPPGAVFAAQSLAANGFANGGLRSGLPGMTDPAAQCRSACTAARLICDDDPGTPTCAPRWAQCITGCDR